MGLKQFELTRDEAALAKETPEIMWETFQDIWRFLEKGLAERPQDPWLQNIFLRWPRCAAFCANKPRETRSCDSPPGYCWNSSK